MSGEGRKKRRKRTKCSEMAIDVNPGAVLAQIEQEILVVVEKSHRRRMSTLEAMVRQVWAAAMKGDPSAVRQIVKWAKMYLVLPTHNPIQIRRIPDPPRYPKANDLEPTS